MEHATINRGPAPLSISYPETWSFATKAVPSLVFPRELFAVANRDIRPTPRGSQPRPMIAALDSSALFLWCYYQVHFDPDPSHRGVIPDYGRPGFPLSYRNAETFPAFDAREWSASQFLWRRVGFNANGAAVTVWIWEGTTSSPGDVQAASEVVASLRLL